MRGSPIGPQSSMERPKDDMPYTPFENKAQEPWRELWAAHKVVLDSAHDEAAFKRCVKDCLRLVSTRCAMCATSAAIPNGMSSTCEAKPTLSTRASVDSFGASRSSCRRFRRATLIGGGLGYVCNYLLEVRLYQFLLLI